MNPKSQDEMDSTPDMPIADFRDLGYLQEVNRLFFHPLGLALYLVQEEDGSLRLGGVFDLRNDPEGWYFAEIDQHDVERGRALVQEWDRRATLRTERLGWVVQPLEVSEPEPCG